MTSMQTEEEILKSLDFDPDEVKACETKVTDCQEVAKWSMTIICCNFTVLLCTTHKDRHVIRLREQLDKADRPLRGRCEHCGTVTPIVTVEDLFTIRPLE